MVVIVIIGLLATVVAPKLFDKLGKAQVSAAKSDMLTMSEEITNYRLNNGENPDSLERLVEKDSKGVSYLTATVVPKDPWGNEYVLDTDEDGEPLIWCLGADGVEGGEGENLDFNTQMIINREI